MTRDELVAEITSVVDEILGSKEVLSQGESEGFFLFVLRRGGVCIRGGGNPNFDTRQTLRRNIVNLAIDMGDEDWTYYFSEEGQ